MAKVGDTLAPNPANPRIISNEKLAQLEKSLRQFGSLDGFVFNKRTGHLISGHQRSKILHDGEIRDGFVHWNGEKWPYREVDWPVSKERLATIAANKNAGEWDLPKLGEWMSEGFDGLDLDLCMFDEGERGRIGSNVDEVPPKPDPKDKDTAMMNCPNCGVLIENG